MKDSINNKSTKEKVLELLRNNSNLYISGQEIAESLFVTRASVWKAIKALQNSGYEIDAVTNKGYRINDTGTACTKNGILSYINNKDIANNLCLNVYDTVESTNDTALIYSDVQSDYPVTIISNAQTKGRGRRGRSFYSPKDSGIYLSFLIHPQKNINETTIITCLSAVAVCRAIEATTGLHALIKWVNDIYYNDKKIAGILTEANMQIEDNSISNLIVGIGINLFMPKENFPDNIKETAGALFETACDDAQIKNKLCASIIEHFIDLYNNPDTISMINEYRSRSFLIGKNIIINTFAQENNLEKIKVSSSRHYALVKDINDKGNLIVKYEDGTEETLTTGEVSVVKY